MLVVTQIRYYKVPNLIIRDGTRGNDDLETIPRDIRKGNGVYQDEIVTDRERLKIDHHLFFVQQQESKLTVISMLREN